MINWRRSGQRVWLVTVEGETGWGPTDSHRSVFEQTLMNLHGPRLRKTKVRWDDHGGVQVRISVSSTEGAEDARATAVRIVEGQRRFVMSKDIGGEGGSRASHPWTVRPDDA